jgi:hypothetical protein
MVLNLGFTFRFGGVRNLGFQGGQVRYVERGWVGLLKFVEWEVRGFDSFQEGRCLDLLILLLLWVMGG